MEHDGLSAATERLNAGAEIPPVHPLLIENLWEAFSSVPRDQRQNTAIGLGAICRGDSSQLLQNPEQQVAMMTRFTLLDALVERGSLDYYMGEESQRKKVFVAAATIPCTKNLLS